MRERRSFLNDACRGDESLRRELESLLEADSICSEESGYLEQLNQTCSALVADISEESAKAEARRVRQPTVPTYDIPTPTIDGYEVLEPIGIGGMGAVYRGRQTGLFNRDVAIKVIKPGMDSIEVLKRFRLEQQALAAIAHSCITQIFEAGFTNLGHPYFSMELVDGEPIDRFCQSQHLPLQERLNIFLRVCEAVSAAHQCGILHRDLKPSNVMVYQADSRIEVKVIDFGIAKALDCDDQGTKFTELNSLLGTPYYMSPEQVSTDHSTLDVRSDIYSLGVLFYELMTDRKPYALPAGSSENPAAIRDAIRDQLPEAPSRRAANLKLPRALDWVVLKTLEKAPQARYQSVHELISDLRRFIAGETVHAAKYAWENWYRRRITSRLRARQRQLVWAGSILGLGLGLGWLLSREFEWNDASMPEGKPFPAVAETSSETTEPSSPATKSTADGQDFTQLRAKQQAVDWLEAQEIGRGLTALASGRLDRVSDFALPLDGQGKWLAGSEWDANAVRASPSVRSLLDQFCRPQPIRSLKHPGPVHDMALSPDRKILAVACGDGLVYLHEAHSGRPILRLDQHHWEATAVAFSPDAQTLVVGDRDGYVTFWDLATRSVRAAWGPRDGGIESLVWSGSGKYCAAGVRYDHVAVFDASGTEKGKIYRARRPLPRFVNLRFLTSKEQLVAPRLDNGTIDIWDASSLQRLNGRIMNGFSGPHSLDAFDYLGPQQHLFTHRQGSTYLEIFGVESDEPLQRLNTPNDTALTIAESPDQQAIAVGFENGCVQLITRDDGSDDRQQRVHRLHSATAHVSTVAWLDNDRLLTSGEEGYVHYWRRQDLLPSLADLLTAIGSNLDGNFSAQALPLTQHETLSAISDTTGYIAQVTADEVIVWHAEDAQCKYVLGKAPRGKLRNFSWSAGGDSLAIVSQSDNDRDSRLENAVVVFRSRDGWRTFSKHGPWLLGRLHSHVQLLADGTRFMAYGWNSDLEQKELRLFRLDEQGWHVLRQYPAEQSFCLSPDERLLASFGVEGVHIIETETGKIHHSFPGWPSHDAVFTDENRLLLTRYGQTLQVWHLPTESMLCELSLGGLGHPLGSR